MSAGNYREGDLVGRPPLREESRDSEAGAARSPSALAPNYAALPGGDLEQIQLLLGHASIQITEQYLGTRQNLVEAVNDRLGLEL